MLLYLFLLFAAETPEVGGTISSADWQVKEDPSRGIYDAVILEDFYEIQPVLTNRYRRVRILSENGKSAAEFVDETGTVKKLNGRVITSDGNEVPFNQKTDLVEVLAYKDRFSKQRERILVPPGLTDDCIVEYSWSEAASSGLKDDEFQTFYFVPEPYYVKRKQFVLFPVQSGGGRAYSLGTSLLTRLVWTQPKENFDFQKTSTKKILTYTEIQPILGYPYGNPTRDNQANYVMAFKTFSGFGTKEDQFWSNVGKNFKDVFDYKIKRDSDYKDWLQTVKDTMPGHPVTNMDHLVKAFRNKLASTSMLHPSQRSMIDEDRRRSGENYLSDVWKDGYGSAHALGLLFFHVAQDLNIPFKLVYSSQVNDLTFSPASLRASAFNLSFPYYGVDDGNGNMVLFVPQFYSYGSGFIPSRNEGMPALVVDPANKWKHEFQNVRVTIADASRMLSRFTTVINTDGGMQMTAIREVTGLYSSNWRDLYYKLTQEEQNLELEREWQNNLPTWEVESCEVRGGGTLFETIQEVVTVSTRLDDTDTDLMVIHPFPNSYLPLNTYHNWPKNRTQDIYLPHASTNISFNEIHLPEGWTLIGDNNWGRENEVGKVVYQTAQEGNKVIVRRDIILKHPMLAREAERQLKNFIAWMEEASNQSLGFRKVAASESDQGAGGAQ